MDGQKCCNHSKNCAHYQLSIEGTLHPKLVVPKVLLCFMCGEKKGAATMLLCNKFQQGWHMPCLTLSLIPPPPVIEFVLDVRNLRHMLRLRTSTDNF